MCKLNAEASCVWNFKSSRLFQGKKYKFTFFVAENWAAYCRAVHLVLVPALNAQSFIKSLKRFLAHRGVNKLFVSDNAKTFKSQGVQQFFHSHGIEWKFNMLRSPRSKKGCLKKTLGSARLTYGELFTVFTEIDSVLNSDHSLMCVKTKSKSLWHLRTECLEGDCFQMVQLQKVLRENHGHNHSQVVLTSPGELSIPSCFSNIFQADGKGSSWQNFNNFTSTQQTRKEHVFRKN